MTKNQHINNVTSAIEFIESNLKNNISISDVCALSDLSTWQFQRVFRAYVGDSIGSYIRGRRLAKAAQLLKNENSSSSARILDIALDFQFGSHEAFSRAFKMSFDVNPSEVRKLPHNRLILSKPKLDREKLILIHSGIQKDPLIVEFGPKNFVGLPIVIESPLGIEAESNFIVSNHWADFDKIRHKINHRIKGVSYGISLDEGHHLTEESLTYLAGVEVSEIETPAAPFVQFHLSQGLYASFTVKGFRNCCNVTTDFIYGIWLPQSSYKRGVGPDFEIFNHRTYRRDDQNSISQYFVPVVLK